MDAAAGVACGSPALNIANRMAPTEATVRRVANSSTDDYRAEIRITAARQGMMKSEILKGVAIKEYVLE